MKQKMVFTGQMKNEERKYMRLKSRCHGGKSQLDRCFTGLVSWQAV